jgi:signal transduction histidine kinase
LRVPQRGLRSAQFLRKDGTKIPILFSHSPLRDANGATLGYVIAAKDVSEVKKLESRMQQSEKLSAVGQLAAGVAHEINNPLGVILGFAQGMARQTKAGDPLELPIKSIEREALRCKSLVQDLLTFARTSQTDRSGMDLNQTITQALSLVQTQVKIGQVELKVELADGMPMILGNKNQVQQVILNLAKNALDAMPAGGTLEIKTELIESAPQSWVCLEVSDTGTGIPAPLLARIFEPFFTTKPVGQGTGLGLSLVSEIVKKHSGEIDVESAPGRSVFRVKFPARTGKEIEQKMSALQLEKLAVFPAVHPR